MGRIRVMVVDDAVVVRRMLTETLSTDPDIDVVGTAPNGRIALAKLTTLNPDVLILDVEMPELDGLQTLSELKKVAPRLPVIMFSSLTRRGTASTLDALALGARDYVTKPELSGSNDALALTRTELVAKIRALTGRSLISPPPSTSRPLTARTTLETGRIARRPIDVVAIGVSTGGPAALAVLMPEFPKDFPVPIVFVQHMPPMFTSMLAERLTKISQIEVLEGAPGMVLEPGRAYIAPGDYHMTVERKDQRVKLALNQAMPENSCRPAVDVLFRSVVQTYGGNVLGVILTGMGQDGLRGCEGIKEAGGVIFAQDEATSVVWGMPGFVARAGLADKILPIEQAGIEIIRKVAESRLHLRGTP